MVSPRVSIGLPVYNGEAYLRRALDSILGQSYEDFECVICDNASTDATGDISQEYASKDSRIRYFRNETNIGLAPNHNRVFTLSRGEFFKWASHDDEYPPQMLKRCVGVLAAAPSSVSLVYTHCEIIDESEASKGVRSDPVEKRDPRPYRRLATLLRNNSIFNFVYGLIRSDTLRRTRLHGPFPASDWVLFAELAMLGEFWEIPEPLLRLRFHAGRSTVAHRTAKALRTWYAPDQAKARDFLSIEANAKLELWKSACRVPALPAEKLSCLAVALTVPYWRQFVNFAGRHKRRLLRMPQTG